MFVSGFIFVADKAKNIVPAKPQTFNFNRLHIFHLYWQPWQIIYLLEQHDFEFSWITESTTEKVLEFKMPLKSF